MAIKVKTDYVTYPYLKEVRDALKKATLDAGCGFWDIYEVMGGQNSMASWVNTDPPLAGKDYIHFTPRGAKRIAELYISSVSKNAKKTKFTITRFGNVLGSNGSVIPLFKKQIENGGPLTVTDQNITRYFMTIPEACRLVLEAGAMGDGGEIYIFDMGKSVKIFDMAKRMISLSGLKYPEDIDIKITGLRPGEKLFEELLATGENTIPTYHNKIMIAKTQNFDFENTLLLIEELCLENQNIDSKKTVGLIKELVPEYISNNSVYEKLDNPVVN